MEQVPTQEVQDEPRLPARGREWGQRSLVEEAGLAPRGSAYHAGLAGRPNPQKRAEGAAFTEFCGRKHHTVDLTTAC